MCETGREKALLEVLRRGLELHGQKQTEAQLGDRSAYLGMSDIARYADCPRAAVAGKLAEADTTVERLLTLQRGHWFEDGIAGSLAAAGLSFMRQVEISDSYAGVPIRAHLDLALVWEKPKPAVRVLEIKSMETLPKEPYEAHERQVMGQVAMLDELWDAPRFTLRREDGSIAHEKVGFPELCRRELGLNLPDNPEKVSIEGWLLCVSMRYARAFGPYLWDAHALERLREQAHEYWALLSGVKEGRAALSDIPHATGFHPLCTSCQFNGDCPKFPQGASQPQWEPALDKLENLKERRSELDGEIKELEAVLKVAHQLAGTQDWINTGGHRFRVSEIAGRSVLNRDTLKEELAAIFYSEHMDDIDVDALLARHERAGAPSSRLTVNAIN
ncbi:MULTISPECIES: GxxExxY protein [unclassified Desulfovibrio]|uniref:GxxExxY protein n=1 Tax=unclassified Desulfovibrio TaxID=2593640 RepID=UPI0013EA48CE|nr:MULTISPECIES: GxxExxY protein [unclassified Desulfovibrio]